MRKYIEPKLVCRRFERVNMLTDSTNNPKYISSIKLLKIDLEQVKTRQLDQIPYAEDTWAK